MHPVLPLLLAFLPAAPDALDNLDFRRGLAGWQGEGFAVVDGAVSSRDAGPRGGLLHRTFVVPQGAGTIHCTAYATAGSDGRADARLNVFLEAAGREVVPKSVRTADGFERTTALLPPLDGRPREYVWSVAGRAGETLRLLVVDHNNDPGRYVHCGGFRTEPPGQHEARAFAQLMDRLAQKHKLSPMGPRFRSRHFLALGNTDEAFARQQLQRCERMHDVFLDHFRGKGFRLTAPPARLMVALFDRQEGIEAYLNGPVPPMVTGLYHPASNRLVVYDFGRNRQLLRNREEAEQFAATLPAEHRMLALGSVSRQAGDIRTTANLSTLMHEAAHLLSFNTGLLNREGDRPLWLAEGLAAYCESTAQGHWKGVGALNPERLKTLAAARRGEVAFLPLRSLVESDRWLCGPGGSQRALIGYAQSWALFHMLVEEQPKALRRYLQLIYRRTVPEHRLADFAEVFGADLAKVERRHRDYVQRLLETVR